MYGSVNIEFALTISQSMQPRGKGEQEEADGVLLVPSAPPAHTSLGAVLQARPTGPGPACYWPMLALCRRAEPSWASRAHHV